MPLVTTQVWRKDEKEKNEWDDSIGMWKNGYNQNFSEFDKATQGSKTMGDKTNGYSRKQTSSGNKSEKSDKCKPNFA